MQNQLIILSGLSGSGKTTALQTLEDLGYYCVDNIPISMLSELTRTLDTPHLAASLDIRNISQDFANVDDTLERIKQDKNYEVSIVFLDAASESLIKRFKETRRKHPLQNIHGDLAGAIQAERNLLEDIIQASTLRLDTSADNVHDLRDRIKHLFDFQEQSQRLMIRISSFGFKNGAPSDADFVFDARHLPNPHWENALKPLTGQDPAVIHYLESYSDVTTYRDDIRDFFLHWIPKLNDGRRYYLTIGIGCTGGKHRSVYLSEALAKSISHLADKVVVSHRDLPIVKPS